MTIEEFTKLDAEFVDYFTSDEGYRIEQYYARIDGMCKDIFVCKATGEIEVI
ncbi:hypothetical protein [Butyricimonas paravirosa]|uniref:hypothetical protein n=1 Tax=Butyricimonas paravirosa TaxID=1472417 RepID=UPI002A7FC266|nr:hypothetical protein [Butyricimonas paravirosa]